MNDLTIFNYGAAQVRTVIINEEPWFVAADVCKILGIKRTAVAMDRIPDSQKDVCLADTPGGTQRMSIVSEAGLYRLIMRSDSPDAEPFIAWVTEEVLPQIRKTGSYSVAPPQSAALPPPTREEQLAQAFLL